MKLSESRIDPVKFEQGDWVDKIPEMGNLRIKTRGIGNAAWRKLQAALIQAVPRNKKVGNRIDPDEMDRINAICLRDAAVLDWDGLEDGDKAVPYSKDMASTLLTKPEFRPFFEAAIYAASIVGKDVADAIEADAKNSPTP